MRCLPNSGFNHPYRLLGLTYSLYQGMTAAQHMSEKRTIRESRKKGRPLDLKILVQKLTKNTLNFISLKDTLHDLKQPLLQFSSISYITDSSFAVIHFLNRSPEQTFQGFQLQADPTTQRLITPVYFHPVRWT